MYFHKILNKLGNAYQFTKFIKRTWSLYSTNIWPKALLFLPVGFCVAKNENLKKIESPKTLSHEYLIQQASRVAVNAATQLLTQTVVALLDTAGEYKKALSDLISLLEESKKFISNESMQQEFSDLIIASRSKVNDFKAQLVHLVTLLNYVEKIALTTAETSFIVGVDFISTSLSDSIYAAKIEVGKTMETIQILEDELLNLQKDVIYKSKRSEG